MWDTNSGCWLLGRRLPVAGFGNRRTRVVLDGEAKRRRKEIEHAAANVE
jgi:hypothetical protein